MISATAVSIHGIAGFAVRLGEALERWGREVSVPLSRDELSRIHDVRREVDGHRRSDALIGIAPLR
jgi:hypothetical protein